MREKLDVRMIELHRKEFAASMCLDEQMVRFDIERDVRLGQLVMVLRRAVYVDKMGVHEFTGPANWWEMLKESHAPQWFLKRYPVKTKTIAKVQGEALFPDYVPPPHLGRVYFQHYVTHPPAVDFKGYACG